MCILVTGSAGLVGRELVNSLKEAGHSIVEFDLSDGGSDIRKRDMVQRKMQSCGGVIHLAAVSRVAWGEEFPDTCYGINVLGTANLLDAALQKKEKPWFLFASSREVYGNPDVFPVAEDSPRRPENKYGISKLTGEQLVDTAAGYGLRTAVVRLSNVYGGDFDHPDRAAPSLLWRAMNNQELRITGQDTFFDFVHVRDCAAGLCRVVARLQDDAKSIPTLHFVSGQKTTLLDLARSAIKVTGSSSEIAVLPTRTFDVQGFFGDPTLAKNELDWTTNIDLEQGLKLLMPLMRKSGRARQPEPAFLSH